MKSPSVFSYRLIGATEAEKKKVEPRLTARTPTNQPLERAIPEKTFREDLYYRLKVLEVYLPPLRDRGNDPVVLAEHFVKLHAGRYNRGAKTLSEASASAIAHYNWPGNVRELSNVIRAGGPIEIRRDH